MPKFIHLKMLTQRLFEFINFRNIIPSYNHVIHIKNDECDTRMCFSDESPVIMTARNKSQFLNGGAELFKLDAGGLLETI